ncbi:heme NO-binding domain-containing protein [Vibrio sp. LaRot3]|uniref:heme NO-binding domain-containing protein n=1 Tax=Vibrio sp. LaRot3 TaxID=2998829 RepID=UPI0022CDCB60|nr:heme NO-binding domain-containing protein [Vibrio sp. LaRot3]MDA0147777.1 heme NO-binding domain-containing protein [Vibrio sp. LaRot3]
MKGIIFTEFMDLVEEKFGLEVLDKVLTESGDEGVYTSVGSYDHKDLVKLIVQLSKESGISPEDLQKVFGQSVFNNLYSTLPQSASLAECKNSFQFVRLVEDYIHVEVKKLYAEANPPKFEFISETETELVFDYRSARCMSHVCLGLVAGCADHFGEEINIEMDEQSSDNSHVRFRLSLVS